jgi:glycosyltransferase involved in cell wall biosynthesis
MRILIISTLYPPHVQGGAEICAYNLSTWLAEQGHDVSVLTTAPDPSQECWDEMQEGCRIFRVSVPRAYTHFEANSVAGWKKPLWHLQDHVDPRNKAIVDRVLDHVQPDMVNVHFIQGIGYNALTSLGKRDIPTVFTLHDLGLACIKMAMFVDGKECEGQCSLCQHSGTLKMRYLGTIKRLGFISPSQANLDKLSSLQPIAAYPSHRVLNANEYPKPSVERVASDKTRLLYVGRLHESKGVDVVLKALDQLSNRQDFTLDILGTGPSEAKWRQDYADRPWAKFAGHVSLQQVADTMANSDMLLVPSIWLENSPGVVIQALGLSLPVAASNKGGLPELVQHDGNGLLVAPGDVSAWRDALGGLLDDQARLDRYRANAGASAASFEKDALARQAFAVFQDVMSG